MKNLQGFSFAILGETGKVPEIKIGTEARFRSSKLQLGTSFYLKNLIGVCLLSFLVACGAIEEDLNNNENSDQIIAPTTDGYPAPAEIEYPAPTDELDSNTAYPPPGRIVDENKRVSIVLPVKVGQQSISGTGPPDLPLKVVSISYAGEELGFGSIDGERTFEIALSRALEENEVLGVILADESLRPEFHDAPGTDIPMIGFVLAQTVVEP